MQSRAPGGNRTHSLSLEDWYATTTSLRQKSRRDCVNSFSAKVYAIPLHLDSLSGLGQVIP